MTRVDIDRRRGEGKALERGECFFPVLDLVADDSRMKAPAARVGRSRLSRAIAASTWHWTIRNRASSDSGSSPDLHTLSWKAASATTVTSAMTIRRTASKKTTSVGWFRWSPAAGSKSAPWACTIPSLISSRQITGHGIRSPIARATSLVPDRGGPLMTMRVGFGIPQHSPALALATLCSPERLRRRRK
jgi:hypothetical protein